MSRSTLEVYSYAVCLLSLICGVVVLGLFTYNIVRVLAPSFTLDAWQVTSASSNLDFMRAYGKDLPTGLEENKITQLREEKHRQLILLERRRGVQGLVFQGIILAIDMIVFVVHWRIGKRKAEGSLR